MLQIHYQDNVSVDSHGKKKTFTRLVSRFAEKTSMQGVPYINNARLKSARYIWAFLLLSAIGVMIFHLYFLFTSFYDWPKITQINLGYSNLQLPAITLCNMNVIKKSELHRASPQLQNLLSFVDPSKFKPDETFGGGDQNPVPPPDQNQGPNQNPTTSNYISTTPDLRSSFSRRLSRPTAEPPSVNSQITSTVTNQDASDQTTNDPISTRKPRRRQKRLVNEFDDFNVTNYLDVNNEDLKPNPGNKPKPPRDPTSLIENSFEQLYMNHPRKQRIKMGHKIKDMLMRCSFRGRQCYPDRQVMGIATPYSHLIIYHESPVVLKLFTSKRSGAFDSKL
ncbi:hypothetical protein KUTeg_017368 [Tegillarca granosa]|uniref:Uncharacterized protein n=1 Tax=Tegillarca granosa TaxID=220873 RepID=A0ABQ9ENA0_TEGGR|nr:hypothetical protein KUTeg_017368 [Tegillarca granosa]